MITYGDVITITKPIPIQATEEYVFERTPSLYDYGTALHLHPQCELEYVVCNGDATNGFCIAVKSDYKIPVGFCLYYIEGKPHIRITQVNFEPEKVEVNIVGHIENAPTNRRFIGSRVVICGAEEIALMKSKNVK
jgi:hypothetical protein